MTSLSHLSIYISLNTSFPNPIFRPRTNLFTQSPQPIKFSYLRCSKLGFLHQNWSKMEVMAYRDTMFLPELRKNLRREKKRVVLVRFNQGFNFNGGDGGKKVDGTTARVLGNLALAVGLTYLTMTGQLGWVLDTIVSLWLLAIILPIIGIGAFLWWAGQDMMQGTCPNCGNPFQVFKSSINDDPQLCPFCSQPFSVENNEFIKEPINFSNGSVFDQFDNVTSWSKREKDTSLPVVDIEAEVRDAD